MSAYLEPCKEQGEMFYLMILIRRNSKKYPAHYKSLQCAEQWKENSASWADETCRFLHIPRGFSFEEVVPTFIKNVIE